MFTVRRPVRWEPHAQKIIDAIMPKTTWRDIFFKHHPELNQQEPDDHEAETIGAVEPDNHEE
jgi:hypothetical protein